ncbi:MAG: hypothetical protein VYD46_02750 [Actinomycetota bacterium]|nr:hypothetical protein [Actinomycetota bacterium]
MENPTGPASGASNVRPLRLDPPEVDPIFSHESERQIADLLDFYEITWEYEPRTFVLEADIDGNPTTAFTPDFYLPEHDLYLEVTTLRQSLVTRKNRKVRMLRERHPGIRIRILYRRDLDRLLVTHAA